jgi:hypothetical protein
MTIPQSLRTTRCDAWTRSRRASPAQTHLANRVDNILIHGLPGAIATERIKSCGKPRLWVSTHLSPYRRGRSVSYSETRSGYDIIRGAQSIHIGRSMMRLLSISPEAPQLWQMRHIYCNAWDGTSDRMRDFLGKIDGMGAKWWWLLSPWRQL